eukprot:360234-Chlamydomonas_euryale.AAC.2
MDGRHGTTHVMDGGKRKRECLWENEMGTWDLGRCQGQPAPLGTLSASPAVGNCHILPVAAMELNTILLGQHHAVEHAGCEGGGGPTKLAHHEACCECGQQHTMQH